MHRTGSRSGGNLRRRNSATGRNGVRLGEEIRQHVLENLDFYLHQLSENVAKRGGHVFFAATAEDANNYIMDVMKRERCEKSRQVQIDGDGRNRLECESGADGL